MAQRGRDECVPASGWSYGTSGPGSAGYTLAVAGEPTCRAPVAASTPQRPGIAARAPIGERNGQCKIAEASSGAACKTSPTSICQAVDPSTTGRPCASQSR